MKHNTTTGVKGADDMRSDATDGASYAGIVEDVDPMALVGWEVNLPAKYFFQDDVMPDDSAPTGVGEIRRYFPGRRNNAPYFDMLITHVHWPLENPGAPTAFECRAGDVYVRLNDVGSEIPNRVDAENHDDGPAKGRKKRGGGVLRDKRGSAVMQSIGTAVKANQRPGKKKGGVRKRSWRNYCAWRKRQLPSPLSRSVHT
jgi:hypothetical protein